MTKEDTEYLKQRLANKNADASIRTQVLNDSNDPIQALEDLVKSTPLTKEQKEQEKLHVKAEKLDAANKEKEQRETDKTEKEDAQKRRNESTHYQDVVGRNIDNVGIATKTLADRVGSFKTTGGIALLLVILALLLLIVVRVNASGDTRLKQLWYMLNGRTNLQGKVTLIGASNVGGGSSGDFGPGVGGSSSGSFSTPSTNGILSTTDTNSIFGYRGNTTF